MEQYIGVDLHKAFFQVAAVDRDGTRLWEGRFPHTPVGIAAWLTRCEPPVRLAVEASGPTWPFVDAVVAQGLPVVVVDPRKTKLKAGYAAKTDRLDARRLADALRRDSVTRVYYPPPLVRQLRELCRYRAGLVRLRVGLKQRIHALLLRQAVISPSRADLFGAAGQRWLATVQLPGHAGESLRGYRQLLAWLSEQIATATTAVNAHAADDPVVVALDRIAGIGLVLGVMLRAEIGDIARFPDAAHLASYAGLVPRVDQSGGRCRYGRITRAGSPWLRWALVEAAIHRARQRDALGRWARQLTMLKGPLKARVAVAHRLCDEVFAAWPRATEPLSTPVVECSHTRVDRV
jgi:transposase